MNTDSYIELSDGERWYPHRDDNEISIQAIAHSLSNLCRFNGHCDRFYSVAEHSVRVSLIAPTLGALLHDAQETVVNDLAKPIKVCVSGYDDFEQFCAQQIARQYGIAVGPEVKSADMTMLFIEAFDLVPSKGADWVGHDSYGLAAMELYVKRPELRVQCWTPAQAYAKFLERYDELTIGALA